jgi:hypothetical protein
MRPGLSVSSIRTASPSLGLAQIHIMPGQSVSGIDLYLNLSDGRAPVG